MNIKPYKINIKKTELDEFKQRLQDTRWPESIEGTGWERGVPVDYLKKLVNYWQHKYDWEKQEAALNKYDQFTTEIDGQTLHFFHIKSSKKDALPLLLSHGWPSSSIEYLKLIEPLINPSSGPAFHLVIPTIPGFGLSSPVTQSGWQSPRTAKAYVELMKRLGYEKYGLHGSDIGADITGEMLKIDSEKIVGIHSASDTPTIISVAAFMGGGNPAENPKLSDAEKEVVKKMQADWTADEGYFKIQSTKPATVSYGLHESPVAQLAWQVEKYRAWTNPSDKDVEEKIDLDQMLTNISLYWFTGSGASSANYIYENMHAMRDWGAQPAKEVPSGTAVFAAESFSRALLDPDHKMLHWTEFKEGRHFPAMEEPELLVGDIKKFFSDKKAA